MADNYYKLVGTANRHTDWTAEVILERDDDGEPSKVVRLGEPVSLSAGDREKLEDLGFTLESSSKSEFDEARASGTTVGGDVAGSAPIFGDQEVANQSDTEQTSGAEGEKSEKAGQKSAKNTK